MAQKNKKYKILKQFIPISSSTDPLWAKRSIWVARINKEDNIEIFNSISKAKKRKKYLEESDPTNRLYKIVEV